MPTQSNPFFSNRDPREAPYSKRLLARVDQQSDGKLLAEAVDADWADSILNREVSADLWREVGPEAPVSILEFEFQQWWSLLGGRPLNVSRSRISREWVEVSVKQGGTPIAQYVSMFGAPRKITVDRILTLENIKAQKLDQLLDLGPYEADEKQIEALLPADRIDWVAVYDVGQGAANALLDQQAIPCMYFDLGGGVLEHSGTFPTAFNQLCTSRMPPVVLSHWDWDHWSSGGRFTASQSLTWLVPNQRLGIVHGVLASLILANGSLLVWPKSLAKITKGQLTIEKCTGSHRNDSGLAALISGPGGEAPILLPGDSRYTAIPSKDLVFRSVVAPHHGAKMRAAFTPASDSSATGRIVYSYGEPNRWSHPDPKTKDRYAKAGWEHASKNSKGRDRYTAHKRPQMGHIGLSWSGGASPTPPCGGSLCSQAISQT